MNEVRIDKARLAETLRVNRDQHRVQFEKAIDGYKRLFSAKLEKAVRAARDGHNSDARTIVHELNRLPIPEDHTGDYDTVISMLEMEVDDTVVLTRSEFVTYVNDDWSWKGAFAATAMTYGVRD